MSDKGVPAEPRLASINRQQLILRSIDVERLIDEDHSARLIWQLIGRLDLSLYHAQIEAVAGRAGREHTDLPGAPSFRAVCERVDIPLT